VGFSGNKLHFKANIKENHHDQYAQAVVFDFENSIRSKTQLDC